MTRRELAPVMDGMRFTRVLVRRPDLRIDFPDRFRERLEGTTMRGLTRRAKYLLGDLSSGETLLMHLGMSGSFRVEPGPDHGEAGGVLAGAGAHDHVIFRMSSGAVV